MTLIVLFQSTRPMRGATTASNCSCLPFHSFNPRAPCGARPASQIACLVALSFQSTRPMRGATQNAAFVRYNGKVSIHAPHAGRDALVLMSKITVQVSIHAPHAGRDPGEPTLRATSESFNPRAPCGARRRAPRAQRRGHKFQSTRPMRGATL